LQHLEQEAAQSVPRITFGSNHLFRAQFNLEANGFSSHTEWKAEWEAARSNQFVCVGSKDETGGNQSCTYFQATHTLRLRLPHVLVAGNGGDKYLSITDISFRYGDAVIKAALAAREGQALTFRFIRRAEKTRSGNKKTRPTIYAWYVQVTTERETTSKATDRRLGAIGLDLNPAFTSVIGTVKSKSSYGLSTHTAAAVAIARRGLFFKETTRTRSKPIEAAKTRPSQTKP
jgi:hypothetical protein